MRFLNFILLKLCLSFVLGIYVGFYNYLSISLSFLILFVFLGLLLISKAVIKNKSLFLGVSFLTFFMLGYLKSQLQLPENMPQHFVHINLNKGHLYKVKAVVVQDLKNTAYNDKYVLSDLIIDENYYQGKLLLNVKRDSVSKALQVGDVLSFDQHIVAIQNSKNPQVFDYKAYLKHKGIYAQVNLKDDYLVVEHNHGLSVYASALRARIIAALQESGFKEKHIGLIQALLLGQKQNIDKDIYTTFADVGIVHILAVSGLHVGIIFLILKFVFNLLFSVKLRRVMTPFSTIICLWGFAFLVGFSPSVTRAVTMFSFFALRDVFMRKSNSINVLFLSAVVLLLYEPNYLFDVGFQLSYAAVFSILCLYPVFSKFYRFQYKIPQVFLDTIYVSLAAQIGVLPFQLFYFHQFPSLFLVANFIVIPFLGILVSGGLLCIILALVGVLFEPLVQIYSWMLDMLLISTSWLSNYSQFVFKDIYFTRTMFVALMVLVLVFIVMIRRFKKLQILAFLSTAFVFSCIVVGESLNANRSLEFVVFQNYKSSLLAFKHTDRLTVFSMDASIDAQYYTLKNYRLLNAIKEVEVNALKNEYNFEGNTLSVIDSSGVYTDTAEERIILLSGSPDFHFEKLLKTQKIKAVIADGSNYNSYIERWKKTSAQYGITFHSTAESGSYHIIKDSKF